MLLVVRKAMSLIRKMKRKINNIKVMDVCFRKRFKYIGSIYLYIFEILEYMCNLENVLIVTSHRIALGANLYNSLLNFA